jgi:hypothetical protein
VTDPTPTPVTDVTPPPATTPTTTTTTTATPPPATPGHHKKYKSAALTFAQFVADGARGCATGGALGSWAIGLPIIWLWRRRR